MELLSYWVKILAAICAISGTAYAAGHYLEVLPVIEKDFNKYAMNQTDQLLKLQEQQQATVDQLLRLRYYSLIDKRAINGTLSQREQIELCDTAKQLGINLNATPGC